MVSFLEAARFKPIIDCSFDFESLVEAFQYLLSGQHLGKICIDI
ncbi:putative Zinc-containing alcohol dehydrogenase [gamma proteobacterium BDW918]|nr:putative Zinc-containing alcohol dehydrogenase [gamma proteobacterium BDW918]